MDIFELSQVSAIKKLIEICKFGLGKSIEIDCLFTMSNTDAVILQDLRSQIESLSLRAFYKESVDCNNLLSSHSVVNRSKLREEYQKVQRQLNIEAIVGYVFSSFKEKYIRFQEKYEELYIDDESIDQEEYEELQKEFTINSNSIDKDWIIRFFKLAEDISNDEMQKIWAKILMNEIINPNNFSLNALDSLKSLTYADLQLFNEIVGYVTKEKMSAYIPAYEELYNAQDLLTLARCGLLILTSLHTEEIEISDSTRIGGNGRYFITAFPNKIERKLTMPIYMLTSVGYELMTLCSRKLSDDTVFRIADIVKKYNKDAEVCVTEIFCLAKNNFFLGKAIPVEWRGDFV